MKPQNDCVKVNFLSDFDFFLTLTDHQGNTIGWPDFDWRARLSTSAVNRCVTVSCIGGVCHNCYNDDGRIHVVLDRHGLPPGVLKCDFRVVNPSSEYPDGNQTIVAVQPLGIELVHEGMQCNSGLDATFVLPAIALNFDRLEQNYGLTLDEINRRLEAILGREPSGDDSVPGAVLSANHSRAPQYLQRGIIPLGALDGTIYRNFGEIKLHNRKDIETAYKNRAPLYLYKPTIEGDATFIGFGRYVPNGYCLVDGVENGNEFRVEVTEYILNNFNRISYLFKTNSPHSYIRKISGATFEVLEAGASITDPQLPPLQMPQRAAIKKEDLYTFLSGCTQGGKIEIQARRNKIARFTTDELHRVWKDHEDRKRIKKWVKVGVDSLSLIGKRYRVLRMRVRNRKGKTSPWLYFSATISHSDPWPILIRRLS